MPVGAITRTHLLIKLKHQLPSTHSRRLWSLPHRWLWRPHPPDRLLQLLVLHEHVVHRCVVPHLYQRLCPDDNPALGASPSAHHVATPALRHARARSLAVAFAGLVQPRAIPARLRSDRPIRGRLLHRLHRARCHILPQPEHWLRRVPVHLLTAHSRFMRTHGWILTDVLFASSGHCVRAHRHPHCAQVCAAHALGRDARLAHHGATRSHGGAYFHTTA